MNWRALVIFVSAAVVSSIATAQPSRGGVELPVPVLAEQSDAASIAVNPAQIALMRGWNLEYVHTQVAEGPTAGRGHGIFFAMPLPWFGLGWGASVEWVLPEGNGMAWRAPISLALSWQYARRLSIGVSFRWFVASSDPSIDDVWGIDLGLTLRLSSLFALAVVCHGLNDPSPRAEQPSDRSRFGRSWSVGLVLRPARRDFLSLAGEVSYAESWDRLSVRGVVSFRPLAGWVVRADVGGWFEDGDSGLSVGLSTEVALSMLTVGGGAQVWDVGGEPAFGGFSAYASLSNDGHGVLWEPRRVAQIVLDDDLTTRDLASLEATLLRAAADPAVRGVLLMPRAGFEATVGEVQDLRWVVARVQRAGKPVACYLEEGSSSGTFLCAGADRVLVNTGGGIHLSGLRMSTLYLGDAMDRLGIRFEVIRVGEYKSGPEQYTQSGPSPEAQEETNSYISSVYRRWIWDLAHDRSVSTDRMIDLVDGGPYLAAEAVEAGLIDQSIFADELDGALEEVFGRGFAIDDDYSESLPHRRDWGGGPAVAVIHIEGSIVDGESFEAGPDWLRRTGARTVGRAIETARLDRRVKAVVLRVDSPGGSVLGSDVIWRQVRRLRKSVPVVSSMGAVAASGGYYVACAADEIYATPATLTGSIGVYYGKLEVSGLMEKVGIHPFQYQRGRRAGHDHWSRPWTDDERAALAVKVQSYYTQFLDRVAQSRPGFESRDDVDAVARGRIWSGEQAKRLGLVDRIGGLQHAIERAAERAGLGDDYEVIHLPVQKRGVLEVALDWLGFDASAVDNLPPAMQEALEAAGPMIYAEPGRAQALLPYAVVMDE
jgi:protease-4